MSRKIIREGLLDEKRPYADYKHFYTGYGYWAFGGYAFDWLIWILCHVFGHRWKWCHSGFRGGFPSWHLQCTRCLHIEENPTLRKEDEKYKLEQEAEELQERLKEFH